MEKLINVDPNILGGTPVFMGTRVPVRLLFAYLAKGEPLHEFLENYPTVSLDQALRLLAEAGNIVEEQLGSGVA